MLQIHHSLGLQNFLVICYISFLHTSSKKGKKKKLGLCYLNTSLCTWQAFAVISDGVSWEKAGLRAAPTC